MRLELRPWVHAYLYALVFATDGAWGRLVVNEANVGIWGWCGHVGLAAVAVVVYRVDGGQRPFSPSSSDTLGPCVGVGACSNVGSL